MISPAGWTKINRDSDYIYKILPALYRLKILNENDINALTIWKKIVPLIENDFLSKEDSIEVNRKYISFRKNFIFSLMFNEPKIFFEKYFSNINETEIFHICNIYQYAVGGRPRRISYLTLLERRFGIPVNYEAYPFFCEESLNVKLLKQKDFYKGVEVYVTPFDLITRYITIDSICHYKDAVEWCPIQYACWNLVRKLKEELVEKRLLTNMSFYGCLSSYLILQLLVENYEVIPVTSDADQFIKLVSNVLFKRESGFIGKILEESKLIAKNIKSLDFSESGRFSDLLDIHKILMIKNYLEWPSDEKVFQIIDYLKIERRGYEFEEFLILAHLIDKILDSNHISVTMLFWNS